MSIQPFLASFEFCLTGLKRSELVQPNLLRFTIVTQTLKQKKAETQSVEKGTEYKKRKNVKKE